MRHCSLIFVLLLAVSFAAARASTITVSFSADGFRCDGQAQPFVPFQTYLVALLFGDAAGNGITGAEFRVDGYDSQWFNTVTPNPAASITLGNPIAGGANIAFPACQPRTATALVLYTIQSLALAPVSSRYLQVLAHSMPSNPSFQCPLVTLCDEPVFTKLCVLGGRATLNNPGGCQCCKAVVLPAWTSVKALYAAH